MLRGVAAVTVLGVALAVTGCNSVYVPRPGRRVSMVLRDGQVAYYRDGRYIRMGLLGDGLVEAVQGNPQAEAAARTFHDRLVTGWVLLGVSIAGLSLLVGRAVDHADGGEPFDGTDGLILGGVLLSEIGALISIASAQPYHYDALNIYNDSVAP